jgi:ABC-2 type transport system ATP-binding protein
LAIPETAVQTAETAPGTAPAVADPVIEVRGLLKRYGETVAVAWIDLAVRPGEIFGILGPNGAGKTTTLELIEGLRPPDGGTIRVAGLDPTTQNAAVHRLIGVQLQTTALFDYLTVAELIALFAGLYDVDRSPGRVRELLQTVGLEEKQKAPVDQLSGGQRQRLAIALALVNRPKIAFLDEPTTGLDPAARRALWATLRAIRDAGTTIVLTTHYMEEAETLCDRVAIMDRGRIVALDSPATLIRKLGTAATIRATVATGDLPLGRLAALPGVVTAEGETIDGRPALRLTTTDAHETLIALLELAARYTVTLADLSSARPSLEDVFLSLAGHTFEHGVEESRSRGVEKRRGSA